MGGGGAVRGRGGRRWQPGDTGTLITHGIEGSDAIGLALLVAVGVVVAQRASRAFNLSQGGFVLAAAAGFGELRAAGVAGPLAVAVVLLGTSLLGLVAYVLVVAPLRGCGSVARTLGPAVLLVALLEAVPRAWPAGLDAPAPVGGEPVEVAGAVVGRGELVLLGAALAVVGLVWLLLRRTVLGVLADGDAVTAEEIRRLGWSTGRVAAAGWSVAGLLGGIAGTLVDPAPVDRAPEALAVPGLVLASIAVAVKAARTRVTPAGAGRRGPGGSAFRSPPDLAVWAPITAVGAVGGLAGLALGVSWGPVVTVTGLTAIGLSAALAVGAAGVAAIAQPVFAGAAAVLASRLVVEQDVPYVLAAGTALLVVAAAGWVLGLLAGHRWAHQAAVVSLLFLVVADRTLLDGREPSPARPFASGATYAAVALAVVATVVLSLARLGRGSAGRRLVLATVQQPVAGGGASALRRRALGLAALLAGAGGVTLAFDGRRFDASTMASPTAGVLAASVAATASVALGRRRVPATTTPPADPAIGPPPVIVPRRLVVEGLRVTRGGRVVLDGVDLTVAPGTLVGLIGPNGSAKSTLLDAISGHGQPTDGTVTLDDRRLRGSAHHRSRRAIGRTFERPDLAGSATVAQHLAAAGFDPASPARRIPEVLGLTALLDHRVRDLGESQRRLVTVAIATVGLPSLLVLDEPSAALDDDDRDRLIDLLELIAGNWGMGVLLAEHDIAFACGVCSHVVALDGGRVVASGEPSAVSVHPAVVASYLGIDLTEADADAVGPSRAAGSTDTAGVVVLGHRGP